MDEAASGRRCQSAHQRAIRRISLTGNFGDVKPVGDGVYELRIDYRLGYRVYYFQRRREIVLLLIGGDKSSQ